MRVGIEVGGTFTDLLCVEDGKARFLKVPSVPERPDEGAYDALSRATIPLDKVEDLVHGSTVVTNAILERNGARVAFVTTAGFRDILFLQRHNRERVFDLAYQKPTPLVHRRHCFEVRERMLADGTVAVPLDEDAVAKDLAARPQRRGIRGRRRVPHQLLCQSSARGARRPDSRRAAGGRPGHDVGRYHPRVPRSTSAPRRPLSRLTCGPSSTVISSASRDSSPIANSAAGSVSCSRTAAGSPPPA